MKERIGFVGLGYMGSGMAGNLLRKGWPLTLWARAQGGSRGALERLVGQGASEAASPRALAEACDIVVLCVTGSPEVEALVEGHEGLASAGRPLMILDCSTSDPSSTVRLAETLQGRGIAFLDAPLSRTPKEAEEGTLDVMAGGSEADFARAKPVLDAFARRVVHTGPAGSAHAMKLVNNFIAMGYASIYAEALTVAARAGLTPAVFDAVIRGGRMDCPFYETFFDYVLNRNENAHRFAIRNALKDMTYLARFAEGAGVANPLGAAVRNGFALAVGAGHGEKFVPMLSDVVAGLNGVELAVGEKG